MTRMPFQLQVRFTGEIGPIEDWLSRYCEGEWNYHLEDIKETDSIFNQLEVVFSFEKEDDREKFKANMRNLI